MFTESMPAARTNVSKSFFNTCIVIPMSTQSVTMALAYRPLSSGDQRNVLFVAGA